MSGLYIILYIIFLLYQSNFFDLLTIFPGPCRDYFPLPTSFGEAVPIITVVYQGLKKCLFGAGHGWTGLLYLCVFCCWFGLFLFHLSWWLAADQGRDNQNAWNHPSLKRNHQKLGLSEHVPQNQMIHSFLPYLNESLGCPRKLTAFCPCSVLILCLLISGAKPEMVPAIFFSRPLWCCRSFMYIPDDDVFFKATSASNLESLGISYRGYLYFSPRPLKPIWYDP